jgi:hypothetical protein
MRENERERMIALIARAADPGEEEDAGPGEAGTLFGAAEVTGVNVFAAIRDEPGNVSVKTIGQEAFKLGAIRAVGSLTTCSPTSRRRCWRAGGPGSRPRRPVTCAPTRTRSW